MSQLLHYQSPGSAAKRQETCERVLFSKRCLVQIVLNCLYVWLPSLCIFCLLSIFYLKTQFLSILINGLKIAAFCFKSHCPYDVLIICDPLNRRSFENRYLPLNALFIINHSSKQCSWDRHLQLKCLIHIGKSANYSQISIS